MKRKLFIIPGFFLLIFFNHVEIQPEFSIGQNGTENSLTAVHTDLSLEKKPFTISFNCMAYDDSAFHAVRIAMFLDKSQLYKVKSGASISDIDYFSLGTGYAASGPYDPFFIHTEDAGHHYVSYKKEGDRRAELVAENDNGILRLRCSVNNLSIDGEIFPIEEVEAETLYLVLFYDLNLNGVLGSDEFRTVSIRFD